MSAPALSVVVVSAGRFRNIRRTIAHLRAQTVAGRLEVLAVLANPEMAGEAEAAEREGFQAFHFVYTSEPIENVDHAAAHGVFRATAKAVALIEDHAYPEPDWAAHIIEHHEKDWVAVAPTMLNANPHGVWSWTNLLIAYGPSTEGAASGEREAIPGHNIAFKTAALQAYGPELGHKLSRAGGLLEDLQANGQRFYFCAEARVAHANPSRLWPTVQLRFSAGRLFACTRARNEYWTPLHHLIFFFGSPLIPFLRYGRVKRELFGHGQRASLLPRVLPGLFVGLVLDGIGQMMGYGFGPGGSAELLAVFEMDRMQHLTRHDRKLLES